MDWLTFISKMVDALAWPVAVLLIVRMFKERLLALVPFLKKLSLPGGMEAEFESKLEKLEVEKLELDAGHANVAALHVFPIPTAEPVDAAVLRANPTGVVMEKWKEVESAARALILRNTTTNRIQVMSMSSAGLGRLLKQNGLLTSEQAEWFSELRSLRNMAAHTPLSIPETKVERYVSLANQLMASIAETIFNTDAADRNVQRQDQ